MSQIYFNLWSKWMSSTTPSHIIVSWKSLCRNRNYNAFLVAFRFCSTFILKNRAHLKVGYTSEFVWHLLMNLKNNHLLKKLLKWAKKKCKNFSIYNVVLLKKNKEKHLERSLFYTCVPKILMIWSILLEIYSMIDWNW